MALVVATRTRAFADPHFGLYLQVMRTVAEGRIAERKWSREVVDEALDLASSLFLAAGEDYGRRFAPISGEALSRHHANVLAGVIRPVADEFATTADEGAAQVRRAAIAMDGAPLLVQACLADLNYTAFFSQHTMATAADIEKATASLLTTPEFAKMPHLQVSNKAIGKLVAAAYGYAGHFSDDLHRVRVIDIGSGSGATVSAALQSMMHKKVRRRPDVAVTALEVTDDYVDQLVNFAEGSHAARSLGLQPRTAQAGDHDISRFGALTVVKGDALTSLQRADKVDWGWNHGEMIVLTELINTAPAEPAAPAVAPAAA